MTKPDLKLKLKNLPTLPGVYMFKSNSGKIIYIGKAKNLRNRVRTYFQSRNHLDTKTERMISRAADFELMVTASEVEALILEANLVHEHKPRYNVALKDDKHFPYIKITNEPFPRIQIVRRLEKDQATYFGPYTSSKGMRQTVAFLSRLFTIRTCNLVIPAPPGKQHKVCLDYHIQRCGGPCEGFQSEEEYRELVDSVIMVLSGKSKKLISLLTDKMNRASARVQYEEAARIRDQIEAINSVMIKQHVDIGELVDRDIISIAREEKDAVAVVMQLREGVLIGRQDFQLGAEAEEADQVVLESFVTQYYNHQPNMPSEVIVPLELPEVALLERWLKKIKGSRVKVVTPRIGEKLRLVDLAARNARLLLDEMLIQKKRYAERTSKMVTSLKDELGLARSPRTIVCFDISNIGEADTVGSCVFFENARPKKSEYRHFKIKGVVGQDDFKMMREIIGRYFHRLKENKQSPPDLVVVDGGKGQLSSARAELKYLGLDSQPLIALAKKLEEVYKPGAPDPVTISRSSPGLILLKQVRDEAHRFAITYGRKVRSKRTIKSGLDGIPGIGPVKRAALLNRFGSVARIKELSAKELSSVKGINIKLAEKILAQLNHESRVKS
ncbi:MAG: excinuclease ABC subunit UvrC [Candidatus Zixiibacteriota bacterium]|nr:MAG: excinuclease ABC subunit UvrC [candidate division Zixibacteria bacterium]